MLWIEGQEKKRRWSKENVEKFAQLTYKMFASFSRRSVYPGAWGNGNVATTTS